MKDGTTGDNGEKLNGQVSDEEYLMCIEIWNEFELKYIKKLHKSLNDYPLSPEKFAISYDMLSDCYCKKL